MTSANRSSGRDDRRTESAAMVSEGRGGPAG